MTVKNPVWELNQQVAGLQVEVRDALSLIKQQRRLLEAAAATVDIQAARIAALEDELKTALEKSLAKPCDDQDDRDRTPRAAEDLPGDPHPDAPGER